MKINVPKSRIIITKYIVSFCKFQIRGEVYLCVVTMAVINKHLYMI